MSLSIPPPPIIKKNYFLPRQYLNRLRIWRNIKYTYSNIFLTRIILMLFVSHLNEVDLTKFFFIGGQRYTYDWNELFCDCQCDHVFLHSRRAPRLIPSECGAWQKSVVWFLYFSYFKSCLLTDIQRQLLGFRYGNLGTRLTIIIWFKVAYSHNYGAVVKSLHSKRPTGHQGLGMTFFLTLQWQVEPKNIKFCSRFMIKISLIDIKLR